MKRDIWINRVEKKTINLWSIDFDKDAKIIQ